MIGGIKRALRWLVLGSAEPTPPGPPVDLEKHDEILSRMERLRDPVTRRMAGQHRRRVRQDGEQ